VARALVLADRPVDFAELEADVAAMLERARQTVPQPEADGEGGAAAVARFGLQALEARGMVSSRDGHIEIVRGEHAMVRYYAASIAHLFRECSER